MDIETVLTRIEALVTDARGVPMSTSCLVSRDDVLDLIEDARDSLPGQLADAQRVLSQRDTVIAEAREQAQAIIENAQREQQHLVAQEEVVRRAHEEAERILTEATVEAQRRGDEMDDYIDAKLANFEVVLDKTLRTVIRGRETLRGQQAVDDLGATGDVPVFTDPDSGSEEPI